MRIGLAVLTVLGAILFAQESPFKDYEQEEKAWFKTHGLPPANASPEQRLAFDREVEQASAQWVQHWPDNPHAWLARLRWLVRLKSTPNQQLEETGDTLLRVAKEHPFKGFMFVPFEATVAEIWSERRIRPEQCLQLTQEAVRKDKQAESDNPSAAREFMEVFAQGLFHNFGLEVFLAIDLKEFDVAESAMNEMRTYVGEHPGISVRLKHLYLEDAAVLAKSEGRKPDALLYYSEAFREYPEDSSAETHARQLWKELGGSEEGFNAWKFTIARIDQSLPPTTQDRSPWTAMNKPLTAFHGVDTSGRVWTSEDLKGKTTLINVWATWCRPCQDELPNVQTIFDQLKDRKDIQVLTVSVDEDFTWVGRFVKRQHYTFPVVGVSSAEVDKMVGVEGVPRTWAVDRTGSVRFELVGYDPAMRPKQILQQLEMLR